MSASANEQKTVLLGVTGCIGAYKACEILRGVQKEGHRVKVVMTEHATHFVDPLTFRSLTHEPVAVGLFDDPSDPIHHISLADEADLFLIAPCTANVMAKLAAGIADDLLTTTALAVTAPVLIAPAANVHMYENPITQRNMATLREFGFGFVEAGEGYLACGYEGKGRMAEPDVIVDKVCVLLDEQTCEIEQDLLGKQIMITAGPTIEPIDPVRYISNHSSGKFGYAIAEAAAKRGAKVTLVSGPVSLEVPQGVDLVKVGTACEMLDAARAAFEGAHIALFAAAVADVRPSTSFDRKMKKGIDDESLASIKLVENPDILKTLASGKGEQFVVGFAAETNDVVENAQSKLVRKNADMIVANQVGGGKAFGQDENEILLVTECGVSDPMAGSKAELAHRILDVVLESLA